MKRNLPLIILLSSLVMGCTQHKTDMPRQLVKALPQYPALYYPSSAEKIGQFSLPAVRMPYRALGSNLLRRFMQRTAFLP
ncbi:hypothetical protein MXF00_25155, partial [Escherichia coli]|nr:hypothetical protein [Escherichia coli]